MTVPNVGASTGSHAPAPVDTSPPLADVVGQMFGDVESFGSSGESAELPASDAGTTPAPETPETAPDAAAEHAGTTPADAASDPAAPAESDDFLKDAKPLPYTVDGEEKSFEGITYLGPDRGAFITPENLAKVQDRLQQADRLYAQDQARYRDTQQLKAEHQALTKLTEWSYTNRDGQKVTVTGPQAMAAREADVARTKAANAVFASVFAQGMDLSNMLREVRNSDGSVSIVWSDEAINVLKREAALSEKEAVFGVRSRFAEIANRPAEVAAPAPLTDQQLTDLAPQAVEIAATFAKITDLSEESKQTLALMAPRYIRLSTPEELRQQPDIAVRVDERAFAPVVQRIHASQKNVASAAQSAAEAAKQNAASLAAAAAGKRPAPRPGVQPQPQAQQTPNEDPAVSAWAARERAQAAAMRQRAS